MSSLTDSEKLALLRLARDSIESAVANGQAAPHDFSEIAKHVTEPREWGGVFVTLRSRPEPAAARDASLRRGGAAGAARSGAGKLRGCMGRLRPGQVWPGDEAEDLVCAVAHAARSAALADPRFPPVASAELPRIEMEISVLSTFQPILPHEIVPGHHGLLVRQDGRSGLLLPQVALEFGWSGRRLLQETCVKAGLPPDAFESAETNILGFTADVFSERDFHEPRP